MQQTPALRHELLARVLTKATTGQIDSETLLDELTTAVEDRLDAMLETEANQYRADLIASRAAAEKQSAEIDAKILELDTARGSTTND